MLFLAQHAGVAESDHAVRDQNQVDAADQGHFAPLVQLTTGAPQTIYWGGLAQGRVRYFDGQERRPGLPRDVAALVTKISDEGVELTLVNLSPSRVRQVVVGAGSFGEHRFGRVRAGDELVDIDGTYFQVELAPASQIELSLGIERYSQQPSFREPWHGAGISYQ